jgi:ketosteroid isomerase-like protein
VRENFYVRTMREPFSDRRLTVRDVAVRVSGDSAWAEFYWDFSATFRNDGKPLRTTGRESQVYRWTEDGWRIVHVHYSRMPVTGQREGF